MSVCVAGKKRYFRFVYGHGIHTRARKDIDVPAAIDVQLNTPSAGTSIKYGKEERQKIVNNKLEHEISRLISNFLGDERILHI